MTTTGNPFIIAIRHFECEKNLRKIEGKSGLCALTSKGKEQAHKLAKRLRRCKDIQSIGYFDTPQSKESAYFLAELLKLPVESKLTLEPFNLGVATGITHEKLKQISPQSALSLEMFRTRQIDATQLKIEGAEDYKDLEFRLLRWWRREGSVTCQNRLIVGSNSTILMLTNLLESNLPSSGNYRCFGIPNGALRSWKREENSWKTHPDISVSQWPTIKFITIQCKYGVIQTTYYYPGWQPKKHTVIILPGYFGNSRVGPYGLYVRLARALSFLGMECIILDYLGSGESSPISRTFELDVLSAQTVLSKINKKNKVSIIGHSIGSAVVTKMCKNNPNISGYVLAPLCSLDDYSHSFLNANQFQSLIQNGSVTRKGVKLYLEYIKSSETSWKNGISTLKAIIAAKEDQYDLTRASLESSNGVPIIFVDKADHNFSASSSSEKLIELIKNLLD